MKQDEAVTEAVAKDLWPFISPRVLGANKCVPWRYVQPGSDAHTTAMEIVRLALSSVYEALGKSDWVVMPRLLTAAQADAATGKGNLADIHRAMVSASPLPPGSVKE